MPRTGGRGTGHHGFGGFGNRGFGGFGHKGFGNRSFGGWGTGGWGTGNWGTGNWGAGPYTNWNNAPFNFGGNFGNNWNACGGCPPCGGCFDTQPVVYYRNPEKHVAKAYVPAGKCCNYY